MLEDIIRTEIEKTGPLPQSRFMELALQHPQYGYYRTREAVSQDFTTAPEISQLFGEMVGLWVLDWYQKLGEPSAVSLIELGPGKGTLMADLLRVAKLSPRFMDAVSLHLIEINPVLKEAQRAKISSPTQCWERLEDIPRLSTPCLIIGNEFFDCFSTDYYIRKNQKLSKRCVELDKGNLVFSMVPLGACEGPDQSWEESSSSQAQMELISALLKKNGGAFLCIDYGYEAGVGESLQALYQGEPSSPLSHIGEADLTCHVDFTALKKIALEKGLGVLGPISQRDFLMQLGIEVRLKELKELNPTKSAELEAGVTRLLHPQQMGTLFKAMTVFNQEF